MNTLHPQDSPCLKLYTYIKNNYLTTVEEYDEYIENSLKASASDTMKILFLTRDCRGNGGGDRSKFIIAMTYISEKHPALFERNFTFIPKYGRWLDLIELYAEITSTYHKILIVNFLVDTLIEDLDSMNEGECISYLAKWLPSENKKHDRNSDISVAICKRLYYTNNVTTYIRKQYRKEYLTPLRSYVQICEAKMCKNKWNEIYLDYIPSIAMKRYKYAFQRHTPEAFKEWERKNTPTYVQNNPFKEYNCVSNIMSFADTPYMQMCKLIDDPRYDSIIMR
jgi:hypothetical protein